MQYTLTIDTQELIFIVIAILYSGFNLVLLGALYEHSQSKQQKISFIASLIVANFGTLLVIVKAMIEAVLWLAVFFQVNAYWQILTKKIILQQEDLILLNKLADIRNTNSLRDRIYRHCTSKVNKLNKFDYEKYKQQEAKKHQQNQTTEHFGDDSGVFNAINLN